MNSVMILATDGQKVIGYSLTEGTITLEQNEEEARNIFGLLLSHTVSSYNVSMEDMKHYKPTKVELQNMINYLSAIRDDEEETENERVHEGTCCKTEDIQRESRKDFRHR